MNTSYRQQLRSACDNATSLLDQALLHARDFFDNFMGSRLESEEFHNRIEQRHVIQATHPIGTELQEKITETLTEFSKRFCCLKCGDELNAIAGHCKLLYTEGEKLDRNYNHKDVFENRIQAAKDLLNGLKDDRAGQTLLLVDTNAILRNTRLETWFFPEANHFTLVFASTVLGEIDSFENSQKNESVRSKAQTVVRQIKEYRNRGSLIDGVTIVKGKSELLVIPIEPSFRQLPEWIDQSSPDDRLIARAIQLVRDHPKCRVAIVTRDLNHQNKADYAGIPFLEPPDPSGGASGQRNA